MHSDYSKFESELTNLQRRRRDGWLILIVGYLVLVLVTVMMFRELTT